MEGEGGGGDHHHNTAEMGGSGATSVSSSRWNPTKEQINMLESLYRQGIRTPSAEQIQQITGRLRVYGHIEGKNVFYWFQNHKARQRQKQKQERIAFVNRCLHHPQPLAFPPSTNVVCSPYYLQQSELGFYPPQYSNMLNIPGSYPRRSKTDKMEHTFMANMFNSFNESPIVDNNSGNGNQETLTLFPLHPTGVLQDRTSTPAMSNPLFSGSDEYPTAPSSSEINSATVDNGSGGQPYFDFFSGRRE